MITPQFEEAYHKLNPAQKEAVDTIEGPVMVVAGPGTGKTQILTTRIANILLKTDTAPQSILVLTFSESAAKEVRNRLSHLIGTPAYRVEIYTFHGFCNEIIRNNLDAFPDFVSSEPITDVEQIEIVEKIILDNSFKYLKPAGEILYYLRFILRSIGELKKENISPEKFRQVLETQLLDFEKITDLYHDKGRYKGEMKGKYKDLQIEINKNLELVFIYQKYQEELMAQKLYDFDDMLLEVVKALEIDKDLLIRLQEKYQYILVDEHQDTNGTQNRIIQKLCDFYDNPNLFVVGDEKQAIYRFQGASVENFLFFQKLYPKVKMINLSENYRSHQSILDAAFEMIENNLTSKLIQQTELISKVKHKKENLKLAEFSDYHSEYQFIATEIKRRESQGIKLSEIVILVRNNHDLEPIVESLERNEIPFSINIDSNIFSDREIIKFLLILKAVNNFSDNNLLLKTMHISYFEIEPIDIYKLNIHVEKNRKILAEVLEDLTPELIKELNLKNVDKINSFYSLIKTWYQLSQNESFEVLFISVFNLSGMREYLQTSPKNYEILDKMIRLFEESKIIFQRKKELSLTQFLDHLSLLEKHNLSLKTEVRTDRVNSVKVMTAHKSKGLEFDVVFLPQVFDGHWGNLKNRNRGLKLPWEYLSNKLNLTDLIDAEEDERRLFFVALTRAKKDVVITFSNTSISGKEQIKSQFISELGEALIESLDINDFQKNFQKHKDSLFDLPKISVSSSKDSEFIRKLFSERGLSSSGFEDFLICPWRYFYKHLLSLPETKNNSMMFGTAIHFVLDQYVKSMKDKKLSIKEVRDLYNKKLKDQPFNKIDLPVFQEKGEAILEKYIPFISEIWQKDFESELKITGVIFSDKITLNGRIDMIEPKTGNTVIVHDFKTGKPKTRRQIDESNPTSNYHYLRQLLFYKILLDRHQEGKRRVVGGVIDFVEPTDTGIFKTEYFDLTDEMVTDLESQITSIGEQIWNLTFWDTQCGDKECEYCQLRSILN